MRALLGYILAFALVATPAMAGTNGPDDRGSAAGSDSSSTAKTDAAAKTDSTTESEIEELRVLLDSQARQIQDQSDQLKATQEKIAALEKQLKTSATPAARSTSAVAAPAASPATATLALNPAPAADATPAAGTTNVAGLTIPAADMPSYSSSSAPADPQALPAARGVSVASDTTPYGLPPTYGTNPALPEPQGTSPISFRIGGADFTPGGFMDLTNVFRSRAINGSIGTTFSSVPYDIGANYPSAGTTEDKFSAQNSRLSLRMDSSIGGGKVVGYVETDFLGNAATSLNTTSNAATLRMRLYFVDYQRGPFEFLGGQDWSMFVSNRNGIGFMPGDIFYTQDMDTNYQLGLLWERTPQFRLIYHPNMDWALGVSMEDPDQYIGAGLTVPSGASNVSGEFDSSAGNTPTGPNLLPDIVAKIAFDHMISGHHIHIEGEGDFRTFRVVNYTTNSTTNGGIDEPPASGNGVTPGPNEKVEGAVGAINSNWEVFKNFKIFENVDWGAGDGRLIANTAVPDFVIRPVTPGATEGPYTASPLHAGAFIGGFEYQATPKFMLYGYDGGVYVSKYTGFAGTSQFGWGISTATAATAEAQNRFLQEPTLGIIITMYRNPQYGAFQLITQASYIQRNPWVVVPGSPTVATDFMAWADVRYTLP